VPLAAEAPLCVFQVLREAICVRIWRARGVKLVRKIVTRQRSCAKSTGRISKLILEDENFVVRDNCKTGSLPPTFFFFLFSYLPFLSLSLSLNIYIYIYICMYVCVCVYIYISLYVQFLSHNLSISKFDHTLL